MENLQAEFEAAVEYIKTAEGNFKPSNDLKLSFYAFFKQATEGDVHGKKPGMLDMVGKAKYQAWEKIKGMSKEEAMQSYITQLNNLKEQHG